MDSKICFLALALCISIGSNSQILPRIPANYNTIWTSQSKNSSESMPCGGGDIGLNVWVENNELLFYIGKSDAFDENNGLDKLGRVRIKFSPNPFGEKGFKQELDLNSGFVKISGVNGETAIEAILWVDVFRPVIHLEINSTKPVSAEATYESWRRADFKLRPGENFQNSYKFAPFDTTYTRKDIMVFEGNNVLFYHRNKDYTVFDDNVKLQGLDGVKDKLFNPLKNNTFGGFMQFSNSIADGIKDGKYVDTNYSGWKLISKSPSRKQDLTIYLYTQQTNTIEEWQSGLKKVMQDAIDNKKTAKAKTLDWWNQYWNRSYIQIQPDKASGNSPEWQVGRNYQLFRYMLGCNAFGSSPTKFNGGLFTYDPEFTDANKKFTPDFRNWCGGTMTAQNQRLVYFPMLKTGDFDLMKPQFDFYMKALRNAEIRTEVAWGHKGASFTEQMENYGLPNPSEYGWKRPEGYDKGMEYNAWLEYLWDTSLEFCYMILETNRYARKDISEYMPLIKSCLTFFNEHYQYLSKQRGSNILDGDGKLILYPGSGAETYKMAYNSSSTIAALQTVIKGMLALPSGYLSTDKRKDWETMLNRIPPIPYRQINGNTCISPAITWERIQNSESPQLYPVFPWHIFGVGKSDLDIALNTWKYDPKVIEFRSSMGWKQDNIWAADLGLTTEAADLCIKKLQDSGRRFPAFWGPGFDWTPDHNWGGSGMIGLQEMLMQTSDNRIILFPAWPKNWDVSFKMCAPKNTTVECIFKKGIIESLKVLPQERMKDVIVFSE